MLKKTLIRCVAIFSLSMGVVGSADALFTAGSARVSSMLKSTKPSVVNITVIPMHPTFNPSHHSTKHGAIGSGIIIDAKHGIIATNAHVVGDDMNLIVTLNNGERYHGRLVAKSKDFDLAVIAIKAKHLHQLEIANSDHLKVGDIVYAIGSPFGLQQTVTSGVVSALNRTGVNPRISRQNFIQTDAPINMGNSGGALVNSEGKLVGMNTAIITPNAGSIGIGFAIPSNLMKAAVSQLLKNGEIRTGLLGVIVQATTPDLASALKLPNEKGALITNIIPGSAADKAGLKVLDQIIEANDWVLKNGTDLQNLMALTAPKTHIHFTVVRAGRTIHLTAIAGGPKDKLPDQSIPFLRGMKLESFTTLEVNAKKEQSGVLVLMTNVGSAGSLAGLLPGDLITEANNKRVMNIKDLIQIAQKNHNNLLIKIHRAGRNVFLVLKNT